MATNGNVNHGSADQIVAPSTIMDATNRSSSSSNLSKDEVGWYFVEQYYTTLSKSPEKLHLFYSKRSQFVYGLEAEVTNVSVGRQAIQDRIKAQGFQDCKVRISNVDSQASEESIVIQVIGETSNKGGEPKKFVQTFVLAQQPSGYFVLNDIFRYINEDTDDEPTEAAAKEQAPAVKDNRAPAIIDEAEPEPSNQVESAENKAPVDLDATVVDKKLEEVGDAAKVATPAPVAITPIEPVTEPAAAAPAKAAASEGPEDADKTAQEIAEEDVKKPETPKDPSPTPVATRSAAPVAAEPEKPKGPPKPMTWASRAAAAAGPLKPVVPLPKSATPPAQARAAVPAVAQQPAATPAAAAAAPQAAEATSASKDQDSEWQPAKGDSKRQNRPQSISGPPAEKEGTMAYIKYVTEKVKADDLKAILAGFGELAYFDINRQKNCAFVEFANQAGYAAAVSANPHTVNGESIIVEQRRPKANAYGGSNYSATRGGAPGRGRGTFDGPRTSSQGGGRGGFTGQPRGRGGAPRGRGASQATNA